MNFNNLIYLKEDKCIGCNKCIAECPVKGANIAYIIDGKNKVKINEERCIHCGECVKACDHLARDFYDDTEQFFMDLKTGKKISIIVAPAVRVNFENYKNLFGYLKSLGANFVYDVSFGADITVWGYLKAIKDKNLSSVIAQPCPVVVNYIQKYKPELINFLAPVHSPILCTSIYMKNYANITDDIAFLSPCISKADEIHDKNTYGNIKYNVTFSKLLEHLENNNIKLQSFNEYDFDNIPGDLGFLFSRPGGLRENVEARFKNAWIHQIEGPHHAYKYLDDLKECIDKKEDLPILIDILNCQNGM